MKIQHVQQAARQFCPTMAKGSKWHTIWIWVIDVFIFYLVCSSFRPNVMHIDTHPAIFKRDMLGIKDIMIFHWCQWKWQTHFALLQELSLLSLASFCHSRAELCWWSLMSCKLTWGPFTLAKTKIPKKLPFTLPEKPITFRFLGKKRACAKNPWISYWFLGKWCACATSVYFWPYVVHSTSRAAGDSAEGHVPHDQKPE